MLACSTETSKLLTDRSTESSGPELARRYDSIAAGQRSGRGFQGHGGKAIRVVRMTPYDAGCFYFASC
jgi:hypothetical protein